MHSTFSFFLGSHWLERFVMRCKPFGIRSVTILQRQRMNSDSKLEWVQLKPFAHIEKEFRARIVWKDRSAGMQLSLSEIWEFSSVLLKKESIKSVPIGTFKDSRFILDFAVVSFLWYKTLKSFFHVKSSSCDHFACFHPWPVQFLFRLRSTVTRFLKTVLVWKNEPERTLENLFLCLSLKEFGVCGCNSSK